MERVGRAFRAVGKVVASVMAAETGVVERVEDVRRCSGEELGAEFVTITILRCHNLLVQRHLGCRGPSTPDTSTGSRTTTRRHKPHRKVTRLMSSHP